MAFLHFQVLPYGKNSQKPFRQFSDMLNVVASRHSKMCTSYPCLTRNHRLLAFWHSRSRFSTFEDCNCYLCPTCSHCCSSFGIPAFSLSLLLVVALSFSLFHSLLLVVALSFSLFHSRLLVVALSFSLFHSLCGFTLSRSFLSRSFSLSLSRSCPLTLSCSLFHSLLTFAHVVALTLAHVVAIAIAYFVIHTLEIWIQKLPSYVMSHSMSYVTCSLCMSPMNESCYVQMSCVRYE